MSRNDQLSCRDTAGGLCFSVAKSPSHISCSDGTQLDPEIEETEWKVVTCVTPWGVIPQRRLRRMIIAL